MLRCPCCAALRGPRAVAQEVLLERAAENKEEALQKLDDILAGGCAAPQWGAGGARLYDRLPAPSCLPGCKAGGWGWGGRPAGPARPACPRIRAGRCAATPLRIRAVLAPPTPSPPLRSQSGTPGQWRLRGGRQWRAPQERAELQAPLAGLPRRGVQRASAQGARLRGWACGIHLWLLLCPLQVNWGAAVHTLLVGGS